MNEILVGFLVGVVQGLVLFPAVKGSFYTVNHFLRPVFPALVVVLFSGITVALVSISIIVVGRLAIDYVEDWQNYSAVSLLGMWLGLLCYAVFNRKRGRGFRGE